MRPRSFEGGGVSRKKSLWPSSAKPLRLHMCYRVLLGLFLSLIPCATAAAQTELWLAVGAPSAGPDWLSIPLNGSAETAHMRVWCQAKHERAEVVKGYELRAATLPLEVKDAANITLGGLLPDTTYYVYCYAEDKARPAHGLSDSAIVANVVEARTMPGSTFRPPAWPAIITSNVSTGPLSITVPFPGSTVAVRASLLSNITSPTDCSASAVAAALELNRTTNATVSPQDGIRLSGEPGVLTGSFSFTAPEPGCYEVSYDVIRAPELQDDGWEPPAKEYLWVADVGSAPVRAPAPLTAHLLPTGSQVALTFDMATNQQSHPALLGDGEGGGCLPHLTFEGAGEATCTWVNASTVIITPDHMSPLLPGSVVSVAGLRPPCPTQSSQSAYCEALPQTPLTEVVVLGHQPPLYPVPVISYASTVSKCDGITVVGSGSHGSGGLGMYYHWSVLRAKDMDTPDDIEGYLIEINPTLGDLRLGVSTLHLAEKFLEAGETYHITLSLENYLGLTADSKTAVVTVVEKPVPHVRILGGQKISVKTSEAVELRAEAEVSSCRQSLLPPALSYSWSCVERPALTSSSADPRTFRLEPGTLPPGTYTFGVTATSEVGGPKAEATVSLTVEASPLVVLVEGGDRRTLGLSDALILDASASYDPDRPGEPVGLRWSCLLGGERYGEQCDDSIKTQMIANASTVLSPMAKGTYLFTVQASSTDIKAAGYKQKSARRVVTVEVVDAPSLPYVAITAPQNRVNPSSRLVLSGVVDGSKPALSTVLGAEGWARWTLVDGPLSSGELSALSETPSASALTRDLPMTRLSLILPPNTLPPVAGTYTFRLATFNAGLSRQAAAEVVVSVNGAPLGGIMVADPPSGRSLETPFKLSSTGWTDDEEDFPLHYAFAVQRGVEEYVLATHRWEDTMTGVMLPQGEGPSDYEVTVVSTVSDRYNASSSAQVKVKVSPSELSKASAVTISAKLAASLANGQIDHVYPWLLALGMNLNTQLCDVATVEDRSSTKLTDRLDCNDVRLLLLTTLGQAALLQDSSPEVLRQQIATLRLLTVPIESLDLRQTEAAFRLLQRVTHRLASAKMDRRTISAAADIFDVLLGHYGSDVDLFSGPPLSDTAYLLATAAAESMVPGQTPLIIRRRNVNMTVFVDLAQNFRSRTLRPTPETGVDRSHANDSAMAVTLPPSGLESLYPPGTPLHKFDVIRSATMSLPNLHKWTQNGTSRSNVLRVYLDKEDYHPPQLTPTILQTPLPQQPGILALAPGDRRRRRMSSSSSSSSASSAVIPLAPPASPSGPSWGAVLAGKDNYVMVTVDKRRTAPWTLPKVVPLDHYGPNGQAETEGPATRVEELTVSCAWGEEGSKTVPCPSLQGNVTVECVGLARNETWQCVASEVKSCAYWDGLAWLDAGCHVVEETNVSVTCMCENFVSVMSNTSDGTAGDYVVTMLDLAIVVANSTQVMLASQSTGSVMSTRAAADHLPLLLSLGVLLVIGIFLAYLSYSHDEALRIVSLSTPAAGSNPLLEESRKRLVAARSRSLSSRLRGGWLLLQAELAHRRDTFSLLVAATSGTPLVFRVLLAATSLLATMSVAAALYSLYLPTNYHCTQHWTQHECLSEHSVFYPDYTVCLWDHNFRTCMYKPPQPSFLGVVLLCAICTVVMCLFNRLLKDGIFDKYISPPPLEGIEEECRDEELDGSNSKDCLTEQVPEVANRIMMSAKQQRKELIQHIEQLQTKARLHLGSRPASEARDSSADGSTENEEILWRRNPATAGGEGRPSRTQEKTQPAKGTGVVIHRRSKWSKWLSCHSTGQARSGDDDASGVVAGHSLGLKERDEEEICVEDELLLLMDAVGDLEDTWNLDEHGHERPPSLWERMTGDSFRQRLEAQVRQDLLLSRRLQQEMRDLGPGPAQQLRVLEYSRLDFLPPYERVLYLRNRAEMLPPREDEPMGHGLRALLLLGVVIGDVLMVAYLAQYGAAGVNRAGEGPAGGLLWLLRVLCWPLLYMVAQQLLLFAPLAVVFYGAYMPLHVQRTIRTEVRKAQEAVFVPSTDLLLGPGCLMAARQRQMEASLMILLSRPLPTPPASDTPASSRAGDKEPTSKERAARKALRKRYLEYLDSYPHGPSDSHLLFRLCYHCVRGLSRLPSLVPCLLSELLALPLFLGLLAYLLQLLYVAQAGAVVAPVVVLLLLLLWALWAGASGIVVAFETLPGTPRLGPQGLPDLLQHRKAVLKLPGLQEGRED